MKILRYCILVLLPIQALGQGTSVSGRVVNSAAHTPLAGAHVKLVNVSDTSRALYAIAGQDGRFTLSPVARGAYTLTVTAVGFTRISRAVKVDRQPFSVGEVGLTEEIIQLQEIISRGRVPAAEQKADTTEFSARAFKTNSDASAEDLVAKMPGVTVDNGTVKSQGEDVQRVLVDGKPFFGNDPTLALRNLPAETVEKIQIFDKLSDQAEFSGFDDGQSLKTMNIVTRADRRNSQFGKLYGGYGNSDRYQAGGNGNLFNNDMRLSVIGLSNNVNQQNFATQDLLGVTGGGGRGGFFAGRGGGGRRGGFGGGGGPLSGGAINNFLVGQQNGIASTNSVGANYSDTWGGTLSVNQSYFFNAARNDNAQNLHREYISSLDSSTIYNETTNSASRNYNHRIDTRLQWTIDSSNALIATPQIYFQNNHASTLQAGVNAAGNAALLSSAMNYTISSTSGYNMSGHLVLRHRFDTPGRTISIDLNGGGNTKDGTGSQLSLADYYAGSVNANDTIDQRSALSTRGWSAASRIVYTEPLSGGSQLQLTYNPSYSSNSSDNRKTAYDSLTGTYILPVTGLSNTYDNTYKTQSASIGYRVRDEGFMFMTDLAYQRAALHGNQVFPFSNTVDMSFDNFLPSAMLNYRITERTNLRINYRASTNAPSVSQLQNVVDNSNPLFVTSGNPDLKQSYTHSFVGRYGGANPREAQSLFALFGFSMTNDYIANASFTARRDTVVNGGVTLPRGTQLTYPVNLDGYWNARAFVTYGFPVDLIGSNLNVHTSFTYTRTPGLIDNVRNISNNTVISGGAVVASNVSEDVDFTLSYTGNYTIARNTLQPGQNSNYFNQTGSFRLNLIFLDGFVLRNETSNILYTGLTGGYNQNYWLWNVALGRKFFSKDQGELRFVVTDLLNQNKSVTRTATETYIEDTQNQVLGRYVMLMFTYTLR